MSEEEAKTPKFTEEEVKRLRESLQQELPSLVDDAGDIGDLLDYTFAMVANAKAIDYMLKDLTDICNKNAAERICAVLAEAFQQQQQQQNDNDQEQQPEAQEEQDPMAEAKEDGDNAMSDAAAPAPSAAAGSRIVSLRVRWFSQLCTFRVFVRVAHLSFANRKTGF